MLRKQFAGLRIPPRGLARAPFRQYSTGKPKVGIFRRTWRFIKWSAGFTVAGVIGYTGVAIYAIHNPPVQLPVPEGKRRLVILGTGWGSVSLLKSLDTSNYHVTVISPRNYFLFTPLLTSCSTGNVEHRSIMEPIRQVMRFKQAECTYVEGSATKIDPDTRSVYVSTNDDSLGNVEINVPYDLLVVGVGSEVSTYGIPGVKEYGCFMKEIEHAQKARSKIMDAVETASIPGLDEETRKRLLHTVVVGGGPTGVEFAGELHDFFEEDLRRLTPWLANDFKVTLVEALPNVLPSFSKHLINFAEKTLKDEKIEVMTKTAVKNVTESEITAVQTLPNGEKKEIVMPYGTFVWCGGNMPRTLVRELIQAIPEQKDRGARRGLLIDEYLRVVGTKDVYAIGDCAQSTYAPTAQVAGQQGSYLGSLLNHNAKAFSAQEEVNRLEKIADKEPSAPGVQEDLRSAERQLRRVGAKKPFIYSHQGSLAYVGSEKAVADLNVWGGSEISQGGQFTYLFWRSAYLSMCFSFRNKVLVAFDWLKVKIFGRDVSRE